MNLITKVIALSELALLAFFPKITAANTDFCELIKNTSLKENSAKIETPSYLTSNYYTTSIEKDGVTYEAKVSEFKTQSYTQTTLEITVLIKEPFLEKQAIIYSIRNNCNNEIITFMPYAWRISYEDADKLYQLIKSEFIKEKAK